MSGAHVPPGGTALLLTTVLCASSGAAADEAPAWLRTAAAAPASAHEKKPSAVVLLDENEVVVQPDGRIRRTGRRAVRIVSREGRPAALAHVPYGTDARRVRDLEAWLVRPSGSIRRYAKRETLDVALVENDVYNEARAKVISAADDADDGAVFGYEYVTEEESLFAQDTWYFQGRLPVETSRYVLSLPVGWRAESSTFNHPGLSPSVAGSTYTWELRDLAAIDDEPLSPPVTQLAPRLAVSIFPTQAPGRAFHAFADWREVSRWYSALADPRAEPDEALAAKARELTRGSRTDLERVRAIARYVQGINYISIQVGIGRYQPHTAVEVFARSYGDCKDKANLMRAMLKAVGLTAHLVLIYAGDPGFVREGWPSPLQFNHCIIAVRLGEPGSVPSIVEHPTLGPLVVFDPTDPHTPFGGLPDHEQGSLALLAAGEAGGLVRMPLLGPEASAVERQVQVTLAADGSLQAIVRETSQGQSAVVERRAFAAGRPEAVKRIEEWIAGGATGARLGKLEHQDEDEAGRLTLEVEFSAARYAQLIQNRLMVFRPAVLSRRDWVFPAGAERKYPVRLEDAAFTETVRVSLPVGFSVAELPAPVSSEEAFGSYTARAEVSSGEVVFIRRLVVRRTVVPASQYAAVREFYETIRTAEQAPVVLARN